MSEHLSLERTHDLIDGLLTSEAAERASAHLSHCAACRERHARISELVVDLRALPHDATPPADLWAGIGRRIDGTAPHGQPESADVLALPGVGAGRRRISFTIPQLAAASITLALVSAGTLWMTLARPAVEAPPTATGTAMRFATDEAAYDAAVDELLALVEAARALLAPETRLALDQSLAEIDRAIDEILSALESDPASDLLQGMLVNQQRSKLRVLRQVATLTQAEI
jgi:hypothetical protein